MLGFGFRVGVERGEVEAPALKGGEGGGGCGGGWGEEMVVDHLNSLSPFKLSKESTIYMYACMHIDWSHDLNQQRISCNNKHLPSVLQALLKRGQQNYPHNKGTYLKFYFFKGVKSMSSI